MTTIAEKNIIYRARLEGDNQVKGKLRGMSKEGSALSSILKEAAGSFLGLGAVNVVQAALRGVRNLAGGALTAAKNYEALNVSFKTFLGDAKLATQTLQQLQKFSVRTPFTEDEVNNAARSLLAFGVTTQDLLPDLQAIGTVSAGIGAPFSELAEIFGKISVQGRVFQEDINQLAGRGVPIAAELAKQFGVSGEELRKLVSTGRVGFADIREAFRNLTSEGGKFSGLLEEQSRTLGGVLSTLDGQLQALLRVIGQQFAPIVLSAARTLGGLADGLRNFLSNSGNVRLAVIAISTATAAWVASTVQRISLGTKNLGLLIAERVATLALSKSVTGLTVAERAHAVVQGVLKGRIAATTVAMRIFNNVIRQNPLVLLVTLIGGAIFALTAFTNKTRDAAEAQSQLAQQVQAANDAIAETVDPLERQVNAIDQLNKKQVENLITSIDQQIEEYGRYAAEAIAAEEEVLKLKEAIARQGIELTERELEANLRNISKFTKAEADAQLERLELLKAQAVERAKALGAGRRSREEEQKRNTFLREQRRIEQELAKIRAEGIADEDERKRALLRLEQEAQTQSIKNLKINKDQQAELLMQLEQLQKAQRELLDIEIQRRKELESWERGVRAATQAAQQFKDEQDAIAGALGDALGQNQITDLESLIGFNRDQVEESFLKLFDAFQKTQTIVKKTGNSGKDFTRLNNALGSVQSVAGALGEVWGNVNSRIQENINLNRSRFERAKEISDELADKEAERLNKSIAAQKRAAAITKAISLVQFAAQLAAGIANIVSQSGVASFATVPAVLGLVAGSIASLSGIFSSSVPSFFAGTESFDAKGGRASDSGVDQYGRWRLARLHQDERVVPAAINKLLGGVPNEALPALLGFTVGPSRSRLDAMRKMGYGEAQTKKELQEANRKLDRLNKSISGMSINFKVDERGIEASVTRVNKLKQQKRNTF